MGREYRYRKHVIWGQYIIPLAGVLPLLMLLLGGLHFPALLTALLFAAEWYLFYRLAGVRIAIEDDAIRYTSRRGTERVPLDWITGLKFHSVKYLGGWATVRTPQRSLRLLVTMDGIHELVQELKAALDANGLPDRYSPAGYNHFLKTATYCDQSWQRFTPSARTLLLLSFFALAAGIVLGVALSQTVPFAPGTD